MKYIAIVPWGEEYQKDQLFNLNNKKLNRDNSLKVYVDLQLKMKDRGYEIHTIDCYKDITNVSLFVFFYFDKAQYIRVLKYGKIDKTIYFAFEPPVVDSNHTDKGIRNLLKYFHYIATWNDALVDGKRIFKFMFPYDFQVDSSEVLFDEKKLLVNISGNKHSKQKYELYSEREKVISFFDDEEGFELYGTNWDSSIHQSYKGLAQTKKDIYHKFKFALCLENMWNVDGYITEKILDCFCAGIVPIYWGAKNVAEYIPEDCFISYSSFKGLSELKEYLLTMTEAEYIAYINNADTFLRSECIKVFHIDRIHELLILIMGRDQDEFRPNGGILGIKIKLKVIKIKAVMKKILFRGKK